ncbi:MAG TPA: ribosome recycling factor, partial [bacterium]
MNKAIEATKRDFSQVRTGRASTALVENIKVEYYGSLLPLNQVANISTPDSRTIEMKPWDAKALVEIEKAILKSDLGITPNNDGKIIRISMPPLT